MKAVATGVGRTLLDAAGRTAKRVLPGWAVERIRVILVRVGLHQYLIPHCDSERLDAKIRQIVADPEILERFRSHPEFYWLCESTPPAISEGYFQYLGDHFGDAYRRWLADLGDTPVGRPILAADGFAVSTRRYVYMAAQMLSIFGPQTGWRVVEIGGGYGGLARLLLLSQALERYVIIDIPAMLQLQRFFLSQALPAEAFAKVEFMDAFTLDWARLRSTEWDLCISTFALSEHERATQLRYLEEVVGRSRRAYLMNNCLFAANLRKSEVIDLVQARFELLAGTEIPAEPGSTNYQLIGQRRPEFSASPA
jgi:hypothetical protein